MLDSLFELRRDSRVPTRKTSNATFLVAALCIVIYQAKWSAALVMAFLAVSGVRVWNDQSPTIPNSSNLTVQCRGVLLSVLVKQGLPTAAPPHYGRRRRGGRCQHFVSRGGGLLCCSEGELGRS